MGIPAILKGLVLFYNSQATVPNKGCLAPRLRILLTAFPAIAYIFPLRCEDIGSIRAKETRDAVI